MYCQRCGIANVARAVYCKACAEPIAVPNGAVPAPAPVVTVAMAATARLSLKSPLGAALMSWMWPGLGCCYVGRIGCGLAQAIFIPVVYFALVGIAAFTVDPLPLIVLLVIAIAVARSAARSAREVNAVRMNARASARAARAAGYGPSLSASPLRAASLAQQPLRPCKCHPAQQPFASTRPVSAVTSSPRTWPPIIVIGVSALVVLAMILSSYA